MKIIDKITRFFQKKSTTTNPSAWFQLGANPLDRKRKTEEMYYGIVFACIDAIASSASTIDPKLYLDDGDGNPNELFKDPILEPLRRANKWQSGSVLMYRIMSHIEAEGKTYVWAEKNLRGEPLSLHAINPQRVRPVFNHSTSEPDEYIRGFVYTNPNGVKVPFDADELIPIVRPHPFSDNPLDGISTIEMARLEVEADMNAQEYNKAFFLRGAKPSGVLTTDEEVSEEAFTRLKRQIEDMETDRNQWRKTLVLENGLNFQQVAVNQRDMDFINQRKLSRDDILSIFRVPKTIMAISDDVNRANAQSGEYVFAKYTLLPKLRLVYEQLNALYLPMFKGSEKKFLSFDDPVPADEKLLAETREKSLYKWKTVNEIRAEDGLDAIPDGDELYIPLNLMPIGLASGYEEVEEENPRAADEEKEGKKSGRVGGSLEKSMGKLLRQKSKERGFLIAGRRYTNQRIKQMTPAMRQLYSDLIKDVRKAPINKSELDTPQVWLERIMPRLDEFKNLTTSVILRYNQDTYLEGVEKFSEYYEMPFQFDLVNSGAVNWLQKQANDTANSLRESMINKARQVIADRMSDQGFTLEKAKKAVLEIFKEEAEWRSERIARTEVMTAYNEGNYKGYEMSGFVEQVKWLTTKSNNPCDVCAQNSEQVVKLNEPFASGHTRPPVHPNCQCNTRPYFGI